MNTEDILKKNKQVGFNLKRAQKFPKTIKLCSFCKSYLKINKFVVHCRLIHIVGPVCVKYITQFGTVIFCRTVLYSQEEKLFCQALLAIATATVLRSLPVNFLLNFLSWPTVVYVLFTGKSLIPSTSSCLTEWTAGAGPQAQLWFLPHHTFMRTFDAATEAPPDGF